MFRDLGSEPPGTTFESDMMAVIRGSELPLYAIRVFDTHVLEASDATLAKVGRTRDDLASLRVLEHVHDPEGLKGSFDLLAAGVIDSFTGRGQFRRPDGEFQRLVARYSTGGDKCPRTVAVGMLLSNGPRDIDDLGAPADEGPVVLGTVDAEWRVDRITCDISQMLDEEPRQLLGRSAFALVHPEDVATLLSLAANAAESNRGSSGRVRLRNAAGDWLWCRVSLHAMVGGASPSYAFSVSGFGRGEGDRDLRAQELEEHLRRIAREVASSGVAALSMAIPTSIEVAELSTLTSREYEIVVRLAHGERTNAIARALFLSESTVRNHLTSVYRKFGVQSQAGLLARLDAGMGLGSVGA